MEERLYDLIFIARPATPEDEIKKVITTIEHTVAEKGGKIEKTEHWGTRKLAYKVAKHREGIYVYQQVRTNHGELVHETRAAAGRAGRGHQVSDRPSRRRSETPEEAVAEARTARCSASAPHRAARARRGAIRRSRQPHA